MHDELLIKVCSLIKELRLEKGISQEDLAERTELDRTYISGIERLQRNITLKTLSSVISGLDISDSDFLLLLSQKYNKDKI